MVRVEWQYYKTKNIASSLYLVRILYIPSPQSAVRSPQSAVRSPQSGSRLQFAADLKRSTGLRCVRIMLQGYNKSILISEKTFRSFLWKRLGHDTGKLWIAVGVTLPQRRLDEDMEHSFTTRRPPSYLQSWHFRFYPPHPLQLYLVGFQFLFFSNTKIKKRFSFRVSSLILFPTVSLHMDSFVKFEFLISWNLWNRKLKIQF